MRTRIAAGVVFVALCVAVAAQQDVRPVPGAGTGIVKVTGAVDVGMMPPVEAMQRGDWKVAVSNTPTVQVVPMEFLKAGAVYAITWNDGTQETLAIEQVLSGGWARTAGTQKARRWVNVAAARSVQESR
jgi:hypothetical protein